jgi:ADP-ribosyltransferase exoenzyme
MPFIAYPSSLENKAWQKAKSALAGETGVGDKLEELKKAHDEIENAAFEPTNGFKSKQEFDDWKKVVDPQLVKAAKLQKLLVAFSQFATGKAGELKKKKTCPSKTRELVEKMSGTSKKMALDVGVCMTDVSERIKNAEKALASTDDDAPDTDLLAQLKAAKTSLRNFVVAMGKVPGLVLTKTGITGVHRQTARELAGGGGKLIEGTVIFEAAKYVFVLEDKPPAGLARGIKKAIAIQTTTNVKVKVRGGGVDIDDETDMDESEPVAKVVPQGGKTPPPQSPTQSTKANPPTTSTESKTAPSGLSDGQALLSKLAINHGSMDSAAANKLLLNAPVGSWLLRYSPNQNQHIISKKTADGKFSHYFTIDKGKDLTLPELISADNLDASLVVRPGDKVHSSTTAAPPDLALQNAHAKVHQLLDLCAKSLTTVGAAFVGAIKAIQSKMQQALLETDATKVLAQFEQAKRQYLDTINKAQKSGPPKLDGKKAQVKTKLKKDVFFEKDSLGKATTPAKLLSDPTYIAKVATTHGISETEAREVLNALLDELLNETHALIPTGFVKPHGNDNTINPLVPEQSRPKLTLEEATAVYSYSTNDYQQINPPLWSNKIPPPPHDKTHKFMQDAFAKTKPFDVPLTVTRGMKFNPGPATDNFLKPFKDAAGTDTLIPLTGYISTGTTGTPSDFDGNIEFVILAKQALDLQPYSQFPKEKELLLNHNTPVKVHSCTLTGNKWTVTVEQILPLVT